MKVTKEKRKVNVIMGMAAGQARLLSITSRMSDNELRAQLINNDKMRLATKSAQVSEAYTTALNEAQLMFTNYDKDNNSSYKELTFNSLTAYNQYNNQYAISNSAGQLLVSETDAKNFQKSADLNAFLACYGLEQTTTYFDETLTKYQGIEYNSLDAAGKLVTSKSTGVVYNTDNIYADGNGITHTIQVDSGYSAEDLEAMYGVGGENYNKVKASTDYFDYSAALTKFNTAQSTYKTYVAATANNILESLKTSGGATLNDLSTKLSAATDINTANGILDQISALIGNPASTSAGKTTIVDFAQRDASGSLAKTPKDYYAEQVDRLSRIQEGEDSFKSGLEYDATTNTVTLTDDSDVIFVLNYDPASKTYTGGTVKIAKDDSDNPQYEDKPVTVCNDGGTFSFDTGDTKYSGIPIPDDNGNFGDYTITEKGKPDLDCIKATGQEIISSLRSTMYKMVDENSDYFRKTIDFTKSPIELGQSDVEEFKAYQEAAQALYKTIYGDTTGFPTNANEWADISDFTKFGNNPPENFKKVYEILVLDAIMDTYGEPNVTWIDKSSVNKSYNENGSAKAQWYTNLYNKMESSGYKALQDGLASSAEWIKFAFESGLVCLEQVDANNNWNSTTYTNCSDITEQTNNAAITKAEAEYNAAMAKIENKDKRYDLELKNIDTEHNSLQTEYDSIKTAIDKNIERTFKIYS